LLPCLPHTRSAVILEAVDENFRPICAPISPPGGVIPFCRPPQEHHFIGSPTTVHHRRSTGLPAHLSLALAPFSKKLTQTDALGVWVGLPSFQFLIECELSGPPFSTHDMEPAPKEQRTRTRGLSILTQERPWGDSPGFVATLRPFPIRRIVGSENR